MQMANSKKRNIGSKRPLTATISPLPKPTSFSLTVNAFGQLIGGMIGKADQFCNPKNYLRETAVAYFVEQEP